MNHYPMILGGHVPMEAVFDGSIKDLPTRCIQVYPSEPAKFGCNFRKNVEEVSKYWPEFNVVFHGPYIVNLVRDNKATWRNTMIYALELAKLLKELAGEKVFNFVLHTGKPDKNNMVNVRNTLVERLSKILSEMDKLNLSNLCLAVETDANKYCPDTRLDALYDIVSTLGDKRVGITWDTEHSYASGVDFNSLEDYSPAAKVWDWIKVVHLNAIPEVVDCGSGLDEHGETLLKDSKEKGFIPRVLQEAVIKREIPVILERENVELVKQDIEFLNNLV